MLNFMRKNANSWFITLLFGVLIFIFATNFGPWSGSNLAKDSSYAALVNNKVISMNDFRIAYTSQFARIKQFRPDYDEAQGERDGLKKLVLDNLIQRELLRQLGEDQNLKISPKTLAEAIKIRVFGEDEEFDKEKYKERVTGYFQIPINQFEEQIEKELIAGSILNVLETAVSVSSLDIKNEYINQKSKSSIEFVKVDPRFFTLNKTFTEDEIKNFSNTNKEKINRYYEKNITEYVKENQVKASHILFKVDKNASEDDKKAQKEKAKNILEKLKKGEDFAKIAKEESQDPGSKENGGDLGFFSYGMMVEPFSKAAFALNAGELSDIVESPFGYHIIKLFEKKDGEKKSLEQATPEIAKILLEKEEKQKLAKEYALKAKEELAKGISIEKILKLSKNDENSPFKPMADVTSKFSKSSYYIPKIGKGQEILDATFSLNETNKTYKEVIFSNDQYFAIRLKEKEEADMSKFEEEKESMRMRLLYPKKRAFVQQYLENLKKNAKIVYNKSFEQIAQEDM